MNTAPPDRPSDADTSWRGVGVAVLPRTPDTGGAHKRGSDRTVQRRR